MSLHETIKAKVIEAMKAKDQVRLLALRGLVSELTNEAVRKGQKPDTILDDEAVMPVIVRQVKQHKDSIDQYEKGGRNDLVQQEQEELAILEEFMPEQMSEDEVRTIVKATITKLGIRDASEIGKLMGSLMPQFKGKADGNVVKKIVEELLG